MSNGNLVLARFSQTGVMKTDCSHWGIIYSPEVSRKSGAKTTSNTFCHVYQKEKEVKFGYHPFEKSKSFLDTVPIGSTSIELTEFIEVCKEVTDEFKFDLICNNCHNWTKKVLERCQLKCPVEPSNEKSCTCLSIAKITKESAKEVKTIMESQEL